LSKKQKAKPVDTATPTLRKPKRTDGERIALARSTTAAMQASALWATAPALQQAAKLWGTVTDSIESNVTVIAGHRTALAAAEAAQRGLRRNWNDATRQVIAAAAIVCGGSADQVHALGFDVLTHAALGLLGAPVGLVTSLGTATGEAVFRWSRGDALHGFLVQHASDVTNPATVSAAVASTRSKFTLTGAPTGSVVHFRVAAIDPASPTGQTPWSDWIAGTVR